MSYSAGGNRASNVPVTIDHQDGKSTILVNQTLEPSIDGTFVSLGTFRFEANNLSKITISNQDTDGHVIVDAIQLLNQDQSLADQTVPSTGSDSNLTGPETTSDQHDQSSADIKEAIDRVRKLERQLKELKSNAPRPIAVAMSVKDTASPADGHLYIRGSVRNPGPIVKRGFVSVCCDDNPKPDLAENESGRLQLAQWIASPDHPLTARVYVNRVWRHLFGLGIVATTDNFGLMGQRPSHPELLDYLATEFVREGWSTKKLIRKIMLSHVYRLSSNSDPEAAAKDRTNRLLWRSNRRRVDAEVLRDSILLVSGDLDLTPGGLTIRKISEYDLGYEFDTVRRSVYVPAFRNSMLDLFEVFDFANPNLVTGHRNSTTLPTQALFLMNSPMVIEQSRKAAIRMLETAGSTESAQIEFVFRQVLGRRPTANEIQTTTAYLGSFSSDPGVRLGVEAWSSLFHVLFASLDFRYVD